MVRHKIVCNIVFRAADLFAYAASMKVLLTSSAGLGHVYPMIPIARTLESFGHQVLFATPFKAKEAVEAAGVPVAACGDIASSPADVMREFPHIAEVALDQRPDHIFAALFGSLVAPGMLDALELVASEFDPDLVVADAAALAGPVAAAGLGIPCVSKGFGPPLPQARVARAAEAVAPLWESRGLEPRPYGVSTKPCSQQWVPLMCVVVITQGTSSPSAYQGS